MKIDSEFNALIPSLTEEEKKDLRQSIESDGIRDALIVWGDILIDGHNRYEIAQELNIEYKTISKEFETRSLAKEWIIMNQFGRRNLSAYHRGLLALKLKEEIAGRAKERQLKTLKKGNEPVKQISAQREGSTRDGLAKIAGVSHDTIAKVAVIEDEADDAIKEKLAKGEITINAAYKDIDKAKKAKKKEEQKAELAKKGSKVKKDDRWFVEEGDIRTYQTEKRFDYIITDPPYKKEYVELYGVLAERAAEWLVPGGMVIAMCGETYLDQIYSLMSEHLEYYWTGCYLVEGQSPNLRQKQVNSNWKPLLFYHKKGDKYAGKMFGDVFRSDANDKSKHEWGQSESGMLSIVSKVCDPGHSILDPFLGAGTTGVAALRYGCLFHGIDIDEQHVLLSKGRLSVV